MKIQECYVENFGVLHHYRYTPQQGINFVSAENGSGKSTFAAFIKAMFYGLSGARVRKNLEDAERKRYKPWQGGVWGGYLCFTVQDKSYRLERTFGEKEKEDTFRLMDLKTGLDSRDYSENIGMELFGVDKDAYMATAFINWNRMQVEVNSSMTMRLGNITNDGGLEHLEETLAALDYEYKQYVKTGNRGFIAELEKKISSLSMQKWELEKEEKYRQDRLKAGAVKAEEQEEESLEQLGLSKQEKRRLAFLDDYFGAGMPDIQELDENVRIAQKNMETLHIQKNQRAGQQKYCKIAVVGMLLLTVGFLLGGFWNGGWLLALTAGSAAGTIGTAYVFFRLCEEQEQEKARIEKQKDVLQQAKEAADYAREYQLLWKKEEVYEMARKEVYEQKDKNTIKMVKKELEQIQSKLEEVKQQIKSCQEEKIRLKRRVEILAKTKKYLLEAKSSYTVHFMDSVFGTFYQYLQAFDEELAEKVRMDAAYGIEVLENGVHRHLDYYSSGTKAVIWFCERMAFAEQIFHENRPVMILDDPFVSLDSRMRKKAFGILEKLSKEFQVIYLSCHENNGVR